MERDTRPEDLLGLVKSFLKGIGETGQPPAATSGRVLSPPNPAAEATANGDFAAGCQSCTSRRVWSGRIKVAESDGNDSNHFQSRRQKAGRDNPAGSESARRVGV